MIRTKWLKAKSTATEASIEFIGRAGQIARVSQYGLRDRVNKRGLEVKYPQRELLGLTGQEMDMIEDIVLSGMMKWWCCEEIKPQQQRLSYKTANSIIGAWMQKSSIYCAV